jgi:type VI secretion system secreted protein VgrG
MTQKDWANIDQFFFLCEADAKNDFSVLQFEGFESIAQLSSYSITLTSTLHDISADSILGQPATLLVYRKGEFYPHSGLVTEFRYISSNPLYSVYKVVIAPQLWLLTLNRQSRVFQNKNIPDIIKEVLESGNLADYAEFYITSAVYPTQEYVAQFEESDYNFISRLMENYGLWFFFREAPVSVNKVESFQIKEQLVITDDQTQFLKMTPESEVQFINPNGLEKTIDSAEVDTLFELEYSEQVIPSKVTVKNYNYRTPEVNLTGTKKIDNGNLGEVYEYGGEFNNVSDAQKYAELLAKRVACSKSNAKGKSLCRGFKAGLRMEIKEHDREDLKSVYVITEVLHSGMRSENGILSYSNEFRALADRIATKFASQRRAQKSTIPGILNGRTEAMGSEYASVDENGHYKVRMPYDLSATDNYECSKYLRMAQSYSGGNYGMHFPLHENSEVLVGHVNDNPDNPFGLGCVPNIETGTPVNNSNKVNSVIRTAGGNEIVLNDTNGSQQMNISTPYDLSEIVGNNQTITVGKDRSINVGKNESAAISGDQQVTIGGNQTQAIKKNQEEKVGGDLTFAIGDNRDETFKAAREVQVTGNSTEKITGNRIISVTATNTEKTESNYTCKITENDFHKAKGPVTIQVGGDVSIKTVSQAGMDSIALTVQGIASVKLEVGGNTIELTPAGVKIDSSGNVVISGNLINTMGGILMISGLPVNIN